MTPFIAKLWTTYGDILTLIVVIACVIHVARAFVTIRRHHRKELRNVGIGNHQ